MHRHQISTRFACHKNKESHHTADGTYMLSNFTNESIACAVDEKNKLGKQLKLLEWQNFSKRINAGYPRWISTDDKAVAIWLLQQREQVSSDRLFTVRNKTAIYNTLWSNCSSKSPIV